MQLVASMVVFYIPLVQQVASDENKVIRVAKCDVFSGVCESFNNLAQSGANHILVRENTQRQI